MAQDKKSAGHFAVGLTCPAPAHGSGAALRLRNSSQKPESLESGVLRPESHEYGGAISRCMSCRSVWQNRNARNSSAWWISRSSILSSCTSWGKQAQMRLGHVVSSVAMLELDIQPESAVSAGDRIISVDGLQGDPELMLNELRTNNKPDMTFLRRR